MNSDTSILNIDEDIEPFYKYILSDKSVHKKASEVIDERTGRFFIDPDNNFLVGDSGGFLMNINFKFINTHLLREAGILYDKTKKFTTYDIGSYEYDRFVEREEHRREYGLTMPCKLLPNGKIVNLHITGEHYNFINYGYIKKLDRATTLNFNDEPKKVWGIPENFDSQYWIFEVKKFARANSYNLITLKSRRKGLSFIGGVDSANTANLIPASTIIHAAYDKKYLTKAGAISVMTKKQLEFYENHTPFIRGSIDEFGRSRGLLKGTIEELITGYKDKNKNDSGDLSTIFTVSTMNNADVAVGKDANKVKCDELNTFPNFTDFMKMTNPTITTGAFKTGIIEAWGTGGTKEGNWLEFERHYFNTAAYDFMPFENVWDENSRDEVIGLFIAYWWGLEGINKNGEWSIDKDGNSNYDVAMKIVKLERGFKLKQYGYNADYISYCSQYANRPGEAFNSGTTKVLSSIELKSHIKEVRTRPEYKIYEDGWIVNEGGKEVFRTNFELKANGNEIHPYIEDVPFKSTTDIHGCLRIHHSPFRDNTGNVPKRLNFVTYDPYGADIEEGEITTKHSLAAVQVWMYPNNISYSAGKILLASWVGRVDSTEAADLICISIAKLYNADVLAEMDRGTMLATAKKNNFLNRLLPDPTVVTSKGEGSTKRTYGMVIGNTQRKLDGVVLLKDLIYEQLSVGDTGNTIHRFMTIYDLPTLIEFDRFSHKGNYDRVSCAILAAYQINAYITLKLKPLTKRNTVSLYSALKKLKHN